MSCNLFAPRRVSRAALASLCVLPLLIGVFNTAVAQIITTVAGTTDVAGRPARSISIRPLGIALAPDGSLYVADSDHSQVLRLDPIAQTFMVVAGTTVAGFAGDGGPASSAQLNYPSGLAFDAAGNLLIVDTGNGRIRKVSTATGQISTVAGGGTSTADWQPATSAFLEGPKSVAVGPDGSMYIADYEANKVRRVAADTGLIFTIAGTDTQGSSGDGGPAALAQLSRPSAVALDASGNLYIADEANFRIRVIHAGTGIISRFVGTGEYGPDVIDGLPALETPIATPSALQFDVQGNLFFTDSSANRVRKIAAGSTIVSTVAGGGSEFEGVPAIFGRIYTPYGLALANNGDIYVSSQNIHVIQRISGAIGMMEVVAGNGFFHSSGDNGPALLAQIMPAQSVASANGDLFVIDNWHIRKVNRNTGIISTYAGEGQWGTGGDGGPAIDAYLWGPSALTIDAGGNLYVNDYGSHRIRKIDAATGIISHYAGTGSGYAGDNGPAINANMDEVRDLAVDGVGNLFVVEQYRARVRRVDKLTGIITTIAGNGQEYGPLNDGSLATQVALGNPWAVAADGPGNVYILTQHRIRKVDVVTGIITTIAGTGNWGDTGDGGPAINAALRAEEIAVDGAGNIFITSTDSNRVRKIDAATGIITSVAGTGVAASTGDNGPAVFAQLQNPRSVAVTSTGDLLVSEAYRVRRIEGNGSVPPPPPPPPADTTPPVIVSTLTGTQLNASGWYVTEVGVNWSVTDPESNILSTSGCANTGIASDGQIGALCTATSGGGTASKFVEFKRDATPPTITFGTPTPAPNAAGWNNTDVSMPYTKSDNLSGIPGSATGAITMIGQGVNIKYNIGFSDVAGNWSNATTPGVNIDKIMPTFTVTRPANGATYTLGSSVIVSYSCADGHSGISACVGTLPIGSAVDTTSVGTKTFSISGTDGAGNVATTTVTYTVAAVTPPPPPPPVTPTYCSSRGTTSTYEFIRSLQFGSWINTSNNNGGYGNFIANAPVSLARGTNSIVVTPGFMPGSSYVETWRVWIDFNQDGTFATSEQVLGALTSGVLSTSFNVPSAALSGTTRMRVSIKYGGAPTPCETYTYGEVEDYRVTIP